MKGGLLCSLTGEVFDLLNHPPAIIQDITNGQTNQTQAFGRRYQLGITLAF
jgi:hypothetical protein